MAPEIFPEKGYDAKVDIWAFGTVVYELLFGFLPFYGYTIEGLKKMIEIGVYGIPFEVEVSAE